MACVGLENVLRENVTFFTNLFICPFGCLLIYLFVYSFSYSFLCLFVYLFSFQYGRVLL